MPGRVERQVALCQPAKTARKTGRRFRQTLLSGSLGFRRESFSLFFRPQASGGRLLFEAVVLDRGLPEDLHRAGHLTHLVLASSMRNGRRAFAVGEPQHRIPDLADRTRHAAVDDHDGGQPDENNKDSPTNAHALGDGCGGLGLLRSGIEQLVFGLLHLPDLGPDGVHRLLTGAGGLVGTRLVARRRVLHERDFRIDDPLGPASGGCVKIVQPRLLGRIVGRQLSDLHQFLTKVAAQPSAAQGKLRRPKLDSRACRSPGRPWPP